MTGTFRAHAHKQLKAKQIIVELEYSEIAGSRNRSQIRERIVLAKSVNLSADEPYEWPFRISIPTGLPAPGSTRHRSSGVSKES